jgi:hypothetical protein
MLDPGERHSAKINGYFISLLPRFSLLADNHCLVVAAKA